jgi:phosphatidylserine/phosphatidylglycerophosphate/cardiolipin synthase-like enzyme
MMNRIMFSFVRLTLLVSFLSGVPAFAAFESNGFELVYTAPVETKLDAPDLRNPADVWIEMIDGAKKTIELEQMYAISKAGESLERVMDSLEKAGKRGVKIRFLVEQKMMRASSSDTLMKLQLMDNVSFRILDFSRRGVDGIQHAKFFVVDGTSAFVGSQNFDWRSLKHIHEIGLKITDKKIVGPLLAIFESDWKAADPKAKVVRTPPKIDPSRKVADSEKAYLVASPPGLLPKGVAHSETELVRLIGTAEKELRIQVLDYYPTYRDKKTYYPVIDTALRAAAVKGVKVKLLVSHWNQDKPAVDYLKSLSFVPNLEVKIATIPLAKEGKIPFARVIHSKTMVIDGKTAWVGTSNWSGGYFDKLRSVEVVLRDEKIAQRVAELHEQLWASEYSAKVDVNKEYPKPDKGGE